MAEPLTEQEHQRVHSLLDRANKILSLANHVVRQQGKEIDEQAEEIAALQEQVQAQRQLIRALRALEPYIRHTSDCGYVSGDAAHPCTCGFVEAVLASLPQPNEEAR